MAQQQWTEQTTKTFDHGWLRVKTPQEKHIWQNLYIKSSAVAAKIAWASPHTHDNLSDLCHFSLKLECQTLGSLPQQNNEQGDMSVNPVFFSTHGNASSWWEHTTTNQLQRNKYQQLDNQGNVILKYTLSLPKPVTYQQICTHPTVILWQPVAMTFFADDKVWLASANVSWIHAVPPVKGWNHSPVGLCTMQARRKG